MERRDAEYHLRVLGRQGRVDFHEGGLDGGAAWLTTEGEQWVRERRRGSPSVPTVNVGAIIHNAQGGTIQGVAANAGGTQIARIEISSDDRESVESLLSMLREGVARLSLGDDEKREASAIVDSIQGETGRRQPKIERIREYAEDLKGIAVSLAATGMAIVDVLTKIHGGG